MPAFLLLLLLAGGFYLYEKNQQHPLPPPTTPPPTTPPGMPAIPNTPTYTKGGLGFLSPALQSAALAVLNQIPGDTAQQTDTANNPYLVLTPSVTPGALSLGAQIANAAGLGQIAILVGPIASWAASQPLTLPPPAPIQILITGGPNPTAQALLLQAAAGGGLIIAPPSNQLFTS